MGIIISRFRKKKSTSERLEDIEDKIKGIEKFQKDTEQQFRRVVGKLVVSSILVYLGALVMYYYYFSPDTFKENILKFMPLLVFPIAIYLTRKLMQWYYKRKLSKNESNLKRLKADKKKILEEVMDTETYKVAKDILEKYAPEQLNKDSQKMPLNAPLKAIMPATPVRPGGEMVARQRMLQNSAGAGRKLNGATPMPDVAFQAVPSSVSQPRPSTRLSLPRPILPRDRGAFDKLVDMLIGDGPSNRYALICRVCSSHNGMALKHEFDYLAFRCAYCLQWNPARKQKPQAPNLLSDAGSQDESDANNSEIETADSFQKSPKKDADTTLSNETTSTINENEETTPIIEEVSDEAEPEEKHDEEFEKVAESSKEVDSFDITDLSKALDDIAESATTNVTSSSALLSSPSEVPVAEKEQS